MSAESNCVDLSGSDCDHQKLGIVGWKAGGELWLHLIDKDGNFDNLYIAADQATKLAALLNDQLATAPAQAMETAV